MKKPIELFKTDKMGKCETFEDARKLTKAYAYRHELLKLTASVAVGVLIEMKSPGCKWLPLAKKARAA